MTDHRRARFEYPGTGPSRWPANSSFKSKGCEAVSLYALMLLFSTGILVGVEHPSGDQGLVPKLVEVEKQIGLSFTHINGAEGNRFIVETLGSRGGFLDFDNDGWQGTFTSFSREPVMPMPALLIAFFATGETGPFPR